MSVPNNGPATAITHDDTLALIKEKSQGGQADRFLVKINRRKAAGTGYPELVATLGDATVVQLANPETWLPALCGGGDYTMMVSHMDNPSVRIGGMLQFKFSGEAFAPQVRLVEQPNWSGPTIVIYSQSQGLGRESWQGRGEAWSNGPGGPGGPGGNGGPQMQPGYGPPGPGGYGPPAPFGPRGGTWKDPEVEAKAAQLADKEFELREKERDQKVKEDAARRQAELEQKIAAVTKGATGPAELLTALSPLIGVFMSTQAESKREEARLRAESEQRRLEAEQRAEQRRAEAEQRRIEEDRRHAESLMAMQKSQTDMLMLLFSKVSEKPTGPDPQTSLMFEMMKNSQTGNAEMMTRIVDAMGTVSKTSIGMVEAIADLQLGGQPEHPLLAAVKEGVKAMGQLSRGAEAGGKRAVQQQMLPGPAPVTPQQAQAQYLAQQQAALAARQRAAPVGPPPGPPQGPPQLQVVPPPAQAPMGPPQAQQAPQQAFGDVQQPSSPGPGTVVPGSATGSAGTPVEGSVINRLQELIEARHEPVEEVAHFFIAALDTEELGAELDRFDGNYLDLIVDRLPLWVLDADNQAYLKRLAAIADELGKQAGLTDEGDDDDEDGDEAEALS